MGGKCCISLGRASQQLLSYIAEIITIVLKMMKTDNKNVIENIIEKNIIVGTRDEKHPHATLCVGGYFC